MHYTVFCNQRRFILYLGGFEINENYCQCCGMPMGNTDEMYGTNGDGSKNEDYCKYCFENGAFTSDCTMDEDMGRPTTKADLQVAAANYDKLNTLIASLTEKELSTPFDFSKDEKKKEAHWGRDKKLHYCVR